jgi:hypothetical protein
MTNKEYIDAAYRKYEEVFAANFQKALSAGFSEQDSVQYAKDRGIKLAAFELEALGGISEDSGLSQTFPEDLKNAFKEKFGVEPKPWYAHENYTGTSAVIDNKLYPNESQSFLGGMADSLSKAPQGIWDGVSALASNKGLQSLAAIALGTNALAGNLGGLFGGTNTQAGMLAAQDAGFAGASTFAPETMAAFQAGMPAAQQAALTAQGLAAQGLSESAISSALTQAGFSEGIATVAAQDAAMGAVGFGSNMSLPSASSGSSFLDKAGNLLNPSTKTGSSLWNTVGNLGGAALAGSYTDEQIARTRQIAADAAKAAEFKPYTISTPTSSVNMTKDALNVNLSPNQQTMFNNLEAQALQASQTNPYVDPQSLFNTMLSTVTPQNERDRLALEQRMAAQGRLGVATAAYGGTPEQLALAKAQQEALNTMALNSQLNAATLTGQNITNRTGMMNQMYAPVENARQDTQQALTAQRLAQLAAESQGALLMEGEKAVAARLAKQQDDYQRMYSGMLGGTNASRTVNDVISAGKSVWDLGKSFF